MQSLFVSEMHLLTTQQFVDTIAFSQATPGPILVSSVFIGYKLAGVFGAVFASLAMFAPSAILMIMVSRVFKKNKDHTLVKDMIAGIKVVVIGLIASSAIKILMQQHLSVSIAVIGIVSLVLSFKYKISPVYLITASICLDISNQIFNMSNCYKPSGIQIIGTQRSGSNLLRVILDQSNEIASPHPAHVLVTFVPLLDQYDDLDETNYKILIDDVVSYVEANPVEWEGVSIDRDWISLTIQKITACSPRSTN